MWRAMASSASECSNHLFEFRVGQVVLLFKLVAFDRQRPLQFLNLLNSLVDLLQTDVEMQLLFLKVGAFLIEQLHLETEAENITNQLRIKMPSMYSQHKPDHKVFFPKIMAVKYNCTLMKTNVNKAV